MVGGRRAEGAGADDDHVGLVGDAQGLVTVTVVVASRSRVSGRTSAMKNV
jgi:hypothetical protein